VFPGVSGRKYKRPINLAHNLAYTGSTVKLLCTGYPPWVWTKKGNIVTTNRLLVLHKVKEEDSGVYNCPINDHKGMWTRDQSVVVKVGGKTITNCA